MIETDTFNLKGGDQYGDALPYAVIYSLINLDNGKRYIGRTKNPKQRINNHLASLKGHYHQNSLMNKDSNCRFGFEILEENISILDESDREVHYIIEYKTYDERFGYNCNDPAIRTSKTRKFTSRVRKFLKSQMGETEQMNQIEL